MNSTRHNRWSPSQRTGRESGRAAGLAGGAKRLTTAELDGQVLEDETDEGLDAALCESNVEALLQDQAQLHEAILQSNTDEPLSQLMPGSVGLVADSCSRQLLSTFIRCPKELRHALLTSRLAAEVSATGVDIEPDWAAGNLILAGGVTAADVSEARELWHVAVRIADEEEVYATLRRSLPCSIRPKLKGCDGRFLVPEGASLFGDASKQSTSDDARPICERHLGVDWRGLHIKKTFLEFPAEPVVTPRTSASAPACL